MFGDIIKKARNKKKLTQEELGKILNLSRDAITKWENNKSVPPADRFIEISNALDIPENILVRECSQTKSVINVNNELNKRFISLKTDEEIKCFIADIIKDFKFDESNKETLKSWIINYLYATILLELEYRDNIQNNEDMFDIYNLVIDLKHDAVNGVFGINFKDAYSKLYEFNANEREEKIARVYEIYKMSNINIPENFETTLLNLSAYISSLADNSYQEISKYLQQ